MFNPTEDPNGLAGRLQAAVRHQYELTGLLGQGGFGVVFAARDLALNREVAIKVLRPEIAAPVILERFRREAEAAARLLHPGIIPIFAVGEQSGLAWFIMPRIRGETLRERLAREARLPVIEARRILTETAGALGAAHAAGFVHRDIKPDNILLEEGTGRVILTDFGIAKSLDRGADGRPLTTTGLVIGTPDYMSPEQAGGEAAVDARSDIYSLGVVGYQMLTGARPFSGQGAAAILMQQLSGSVPSVGQRRPECPASVAVAVDRCLAADPSARWASSEEFLAAMRRDSRATLDGNSARQQREGGARLLRQFRRLAGWLATALLLAAIADATRGSVLAFPLTFLVAAAVLASRYGALWVSGFDWRQILGRAAGGPSNANPETPMDAADLHPVAVQARSDRAAILRLVADLPKAEREPLGELSAPIDEAVARVEELARSLEIAQTEGDGLRAAEVGRALTSAAMPLGGLLMFLREHRRSGLAGDVGELRTMLAALRSPDAGRPPRR